MESDRNPEYASKEIGKTNHKINIVLVEIKSLKQVENFKYVRVILNDITNVSQHWKHIHK